MNHPDSVQECTSQVFEGQISLADPAQSWVAKWQRLDGYVPGVYAVKVVGIVSPNTVIFPLLSMRCCVVLGKMSAMGVS